MNKEVNASLLAELNLAEGEEITAETLDELSNGKEDNEDE
jgi:hypothetical protein